MKLYPHQEEYMDKLRAAIKEHKRVLMQAPTAYGKSTLIAEMFKGIHAKGKKAWFVIHRVELREQVEKILIKAKVPYGLVIAGNKYDASKNIQICMVLTLKNRIHLMDKPDIVFLDEAHLSCSKTYLNLLEQLPDTYIIGGTATPRRTDRKPLKQIYNYMLCSEDVRWLIDNEYLAKYKLYRPSNFDLRGVHIKRGDYDPRELAAALDKSSITGDALEHYIRLASGKKFLIFDYSVKASKESAELFTANGFPCQHVDADTPKKERKEALEKFRAGELTGLSNYALFTEGVDISDIECVILKRPTKSIIVYRQSIGRGFRKANDDKTLIILDHAGASIEHGLPCEAVEWTLEGRDKKNKRSPAPTKSCPVCYAVTTMGATVCDECGEVFPKRETVIKFVPGSLQEVDQSARFIKPRKYPLRWFITAFTLKEHKIMAQLHGKNPNWGYYVWRDRRERKEV